MLFKNTLYTIIIVTAFFGSLEVILAAAGVRPVLLTEDPLVGFAENVPLFVETTRADGSIILKTAPNRLRLFNHQEFPGEKGSNSYRIFCMGGSTTHGRPYYDPVSFCGWLRAYLNAADPARNWEVINAGGVSFASYRVAKLMNELSEYQPDLFIVYSGQNEFLEERSYGQLASLPDWLINLHATLSGTRTYTALQYLIDAVQSDSLENAQQRSMLSGEVDEILTRSVGPESYHRDDALKQQIVTHYRLNMTRMVSIARSVGADLLFVQPAINLKDMSPFKSEHKEGLDEEARKAWGALYRRARALQEAGDNAEALAVYRQALGIDDRHADLHFRIGQVHFDLGHYEEAERVFRRAVDEDIVPLRILSSMQRIVQDVASQEDVPLVDFPAILRQAYLSRYEHAVFGKEYFRDHVHTDKEGYRLLGLTLFDYLVRQGVVTPDASWNDARREAVEQAVIAGLDPRIEGRASLMLGKVFAWAGKFDEAYASFRRTLEILGPSPMIYDRLARSSYLSGRYDDTIRHLRQTLKLYPGMPGVHEKLAMLLGLQGKTDEAVEHCLAELKLDPTDYTVHAGLAYLLEQKGEDTAALEHYRLALSYKPDHEYALVKLAHLLIAQNRYDEALVVSQDALRVNPDQHLAHSALGRIMQEQGNTEKAMWHFAEALRLKPDSEVARENLLQVQVKYDKAGVVSDRSN